MKLQRKNSFAISRDSILFIMAFLLLFLGFYRNQWQVVRAKKFSLFQKDVESYVIARMVLSRQSGILSQGGLLGWGDVTMEDVREDDYQRQYDVYFKGLSFKSYSAKESHPGFQGIFFSICDRLSPFSPLNNLRFFRMFTAMLYAVVIAGWIVWFRRELGWTTAIFVLVSTLTSQWMTLFGRNLFFVSGLFYLPALVLLFRLQNERTGKQFSYDGLFVTTFMLILLKCLFNGYDFILPTLGMTASPIVFYGVQEKWNREKFFKRFMAVVLASSAAILLSLCILAIQNMSASGSFQQGINSILQTINRRTFSSDPSLPLIYTLARDASVWSILKTYLSESYFFKVDIPYYAFMILFAVMSIIYLKSRKVFRSSKGYALLAATWFSLLGPLSWYTIFKSVAYFHAHMNYLPWHMPFTLLGFGLCGFVVESFYHRP